jgi:hypothetical protein
MTHALPKIRHEPHRQTPRHRGGGVSAATPPYARPRKNKKQLRESDASQPPGHSGGVQQGSVGNPATRQTARNAKQSQLASEPPTRHALPSATQNSCKVYNSAKEDAPATLTRPASSAGHTTKKGKRTRGTATHLGAHHHPEELSLAHRTKRPARDLWAQLQLAGREHEGIHQKAEKDDGEGGVVLDFDQRHQRNRTPNDGRSSNAESAINILSHRSP